MEKATLAAGCFWGVQAAYDKTSGVQETIVGYAGGDTENPTYEEVCTGKTGHAEAIQIIFDPKEVFYEKLLDVFWSLHDPTQKNKQGPDIGHQYRSAIFYHSDEQKEKAIASKEAQEESGKYEKPVVTEIEEAGEFYPAEDYHQKYYIEHPGVCPDSEY